MDIEKSVELVSVDSSSGVLKYSLMSKQCQNNSILEEDNCTELGKTLYGIKIERICNNITQDYETTGWLSVNKNKVVSIIKLLSKYAVSPSSSIYVVDDLYNELINI